jgi:hypothetical protein
MDRGRERLAVGPEHRGKTRSPLGANDVMSSTPVAPDGDRRTPLADWRHDKQVEAGMNVNIWDVHEQIHALVRARRPIDPRRLAGPGTSLEDVLPDAGGGS